MTAPLNIRQAASEVLSFWFNSLTPAQWWRTDRALDAEIAERFAELHARLSRDVDPGWLERADTALAAVIVLDQFSRNIHRGAAQAFAQDAAARRVADAALAKGFDKELPEQRRNFIYMPYMHSEDMADQERSLELFAEMGGDHEKHARQHYEVVAEFGRFPKRNEALGRQSTPAEQAHNQRSDSVV